MRHTVILALAVAVFLACACGGHEKLASTGPTPAGARATLSPAPSQHEAKTPTPQSEPFIFRVASVEEDASQLAHSSAREGWRKVGFDIDVQYNGGAPQDSFCFGLVASFNAANGGEYPLEPTEGWCMPLVMGLKARLHFEGEVPLSLPSMTGGTITVRVGDAQFTSYPNLSQVFAQGVIPLETGIAFEPGPLDANAKAFGSTVSSSGITLSVQSLRSAKVYAQDGVEVVYTIGNQTPYDVSAPVDRVSLVDGQGHPDASPFGSEDCVVPPGMTKECSAGIDAIPDSTHVLVLLRLKGSTGEGEWYAFKGGGG